MSEAVIEADCVEFVLEAENWSEHESLLDRCRAAIEAGLDQLEDPRAGAAVILFSDDATVHELNRRFRDKDKPTNVLSFPAPDREGYPGDVILAYETCAREAQAAGLSLIDHAAHLALHGVLHLNGFDHQEEDEATEMEALETAVLTGLGMSDPYLVQE
ncbi:MAG: rRNA maturation RNase YbeY [Oceanicaulis sp.]|jgi:probable rRNA maturation factor|nr:rRNA maturation RNase YbeY [Oceanicaulis sp.]